MIPAGAPLIDWSSPTWGQPGTNVHVASWSPDAHDLSEAVES